MKQNEMYVAFHIGRLGKFRTPGHRTFIGEYNLQDLIELNSDNLMMIDTKWDEEKMVEIELPENEWKLVDTGSNTILEGKEDIEALIGTLDFDTIYDTDYATTFDKLSDTEIDIIYQAYVDGNYMSDELKDAVCDSKGLKRAKFIKTYPSNLEVKTQMGMVTIDFDGQHGLFTKKEMSNSLEEDGWCPVSIEMIIDKLNTGDFFVYD